MTLFRIALLILVGIMSMCTIQVNADDLPFVHPLFTDNMVLQRGMVDPVWGWSTPGAKVAVTFEGKTTTAVAGSDGKWMAKIGPFSAGGPHDLIVSGPQTVTLRNVMVGDVWICAGQSNMEFGVGNVTDEGDFIQHSANPNLRLFEVQRDVQIAPAKVLTGNWNVCRPDTITRGVWNGFSAMGYFFGKEIQEKEQIPVGMIGTYWGGTVAEAWSSAGSLEKIADFKPSVDAIRNGTLDISKSHQNTPTVLYNGMVAPLQPFAIKGVIWYQGSSNASRGIQYRTLLPNLINCWREGWGQGDFPFYIGSLTAFGVRHPEPVEKSNWSEIREAQRLAANSVPNSGEAMAYDTGDANNIHGQHKATLAHRFALVAEAKTYGAKIEYSGPDFTHMDPPESAKITLHFDHAEGLNAAAVDTVANVPPTPAGTLVGFQIAGVDKQWVWAEAAIKGETVVVSAASVPNPVAVRYAWHNNPAGNLFNSAGLPAAPFRTDMPPNPPE